MAHYFRVGAALEAAEHLEETQYACGEVGDAGGGVVPRGEL